MLQVLPEKESVKVLKECVEIQLRKSADYQNPKSTVRQADHYPHGINTITDMVHQKMVRAKSLLEAMEFGGDQPPNFESIEDSFKDAINYLSFAVSYMRKKMDGQDMSRDIFNKPINTVPPNSLPPNWGGTPNWNTVTSGGMTVTGAPMTVTGAPSANS